MTTKEAKLAWWRQKHGKARLRRQKFYEMVDQSKFDALSLEDRYLLTAYFGLDGTFKTMTAIANEWNMSKQGVYYRKNYALKKLGIDKEL